MSGEAEVIPPEKPSLEERIARLEEWSKEVDKKVTIIDGWAGQADQLLKKLVENAGRGSPTGVSPPFPPGQASPGGDREWDRLMTIAQLGQSMLNMRKSPYDELVGQLIPQVLAQTLTQGLEMNRAVTDIVKQVVAKKIGTEVGSEITLKG